MLDTPINGVAKTPPPAGKSGVHQHTIRVPDPLEQRIVRAMSLEGLQTYNDFVLSALTRRCREIERENGVEATTPSDSSQ